MGLENLILFFLDFEAWGVNSSSVRFLRPTHYKDLGVPVRISQRCSVCRFEYAGFLRITFHSCGRHSSNRVDFYEEFCGRGVTTKSPKRSYLRGSLNFGRMYKDEGIECLCYSLGGMEKWLNLFRSRVKKKDISTLAVKDKRRYE